MIADKLANYAALGTRSLVGILLLLAASSAQATSSVSGFAVAQNAPSLLVRLTPITPTVCVGGDLELQFELTNLTASEIKFYEPYLYSASTFHPFKSPGESASRGVNGKEYFVTSVWPTVDPEVDRLVRIASHTTSQEIVTLKNSDMVEKPGKFVFQGWVNSAESNETVFEVYDCGTTQESEQQP